VDRRELIQWMVATGGLAALNRLSARDLTALGGEAHRDGTRSAKRVLDSYATATVTVAAEIIVPSGDTPGATDAGVAAFIDTMLGGWYPAADRDRFLDGLKALDARSMTVGGRAFVDSPSASQLTVLESFDADVNALRAMNSATAHEHWFAMLKFLTVWGYCTSEVGMRDTLNAWPMPMRYDGNASVTR
jgi:Gluconate 2-dehydrogenase subunit 3